MPGIEINVVAHDELTSSDLVGLRRISAAELSIDRSGRPSEDQPGQPLLILPVEVEVADWPAGAVDLRGRAW